MNTIPRNSANGRFSATGNASRRIDDVRPLPATKPEVQHIPVGEAVEVKTVHSPLSAYMVNSKYIDRNAYLEPKRPLGPTPSPATRSTPQPGARTPQAAFYDRAPGYAAPGLSLTDRIRRPVRMAPLAAAPVGAGMASHHDERPALLVKSSAAIAAFFLLMREKLILVKDLMAHKMQHFRLTHPRVHYSAIHGAMVKKFGMRDAWFKLAIPVFIFAFLLALGIFTGIMAPGEKTFNPSGSDNSGGSGSPGSSQSSQGGQAGSGSQSGSSSAQSGSVAGSGQAQGTSGAQLQPSQVNPSSGSSVLGGRGAGTGGTSTAPAPNGGTSTTPIVSTGSNTPAQALPMPGGTGSVLPNTQLPLPVTVTVPPVNTSADGKTIVNTTPIGVTIN